jgi:hypothetical protein
MDSNWGATCRKKKRWNAPNATRSRENLPLPKPANSSAKKCTTSVKVSTAALAAASHRHRPFQGPPSGRQARPTKTRTLINKGSQASRARSGKGPLTRPPHVTDPFPHDHECIRARAPQFGLAFRPVASDSWRGPPPRAFFIASRGDESGSHKRQVGPPPLRTKSRPDKNTTGQITGAKTFLLSNTRQGPSLSALNTRLAKFVRPFAFEQGHTHSRYHPVHLSRFMLCRAGERTPR